MDKVEGVKAAPGFAEKVNPYPVRTSVTRRGSHRTPKGRRFVKRRLALRDGMTCGLCGGVLKNLGKNEVSLDHIVPLSRGGSEHLTNLRLAHPWCNQARGNAHEARSAEEGVSPTSPRPQTEQR